MGESEARFTILRKSADGSALLRRYADARLPSEAERASTANFDAV